VIQKREISINFQVKRQAESSLFDFFRNYAMSSTSQEDELLSIVSRSLNEPRKLITLIGTNE
jgi:hypothetical protein